MDDTLGDICKTFEAEHEGPALGGNGWIVARLDGRGFSKLTRGLTKPYDTRMAGVMDAVARHVLASSGALAAYHQSDEISLFWGPIGEGQMRAFGGRRSKWLSVLAASATSALMRALDKEGLSALADRFPHMDARLMTVTGAQEAGMVLAWRAQDARRNAIQGLAQRHYAQRELSGHPLGVLREMLVQAGAPFEEMPQAYRNGTLLFHQAYQDTLSEAERQAIPAHARPEPGAVFTRRRVEARTDFCPENPRDAAIFLSNLAGLDPDQEKHP